MLIRRAEQKDREAVWRTHTAAIREICRSHYTEDELEAWTNLLSPRRYEQAIERLEFFVAEDAGEVVGFGTLNVESGEVEAVYVNPPAARRGVGSRLLQTLEESARRSGLTRLHLSASLNAVGFYERAGYVSGGSARHRLQSGVEIECVPMSKELRTGAAAFDAAKGEDDGS
jgi:N-acetylglutamate synthase-like GNAT family acetyltransferase